MGFSKSAIDNACFKFRILLDPKIMKRNRLKGSKLGSKILSKKYKKRGKLLDVGENLGYILGVLFGDGSAVDLGKRGCIELRTTNKSFALAFYNSLFSYTNEEPKYHIRKYNKHFKKENRTYKNIIYHEVFFNSVYFARNVINLFGETDTKEWTINIKKFNSFGEEFIFSFIKGIFDSDGCFHFKKKLNHYKGSLEFSSTNKQGIETFQLLLKNLNLSFNLNRTLKDGFYEYRLRTSKISTIIDFYRIIGFSVDYKQRKLQEYIRHLNNKHFH